MVYNSFAELNARYGEKDRQDMSPEEHRQFVADCFDTYEAIGFAKRFQSPYSVGTVRKFSGMTFTVNGRLTEKEADLETLPMWRITLENGKEIDAYPEEICLVEQDAAKAPTPVCYRVNGETKCNYDRVISLSDKDYVILGIENSDKELYFQTWKSIEDMKADRESGRSVLPEDSDELVYVCVLGERNKELVGKKFLDFVNAYGFNAK